MAEATQTYDEGFDLGWNLAEDAELKRIANTITEEDVLAMSNMFMEFCERLLDNTATPYQAGFVEGVAEFGKSIDKSATESTAVS